MKPTVDELHNSERYELIDSFKVDDMSQFLMRELGLNQKKKVTKAAPKKWIIGVALLGLVIVGAGIGFLLGKQFGNVLDKPVNPSLNKGLQTALDMGGQSILAMLGFFVILPLHELIHATVFKYYGAPKVGFGGSWKSMIVYAYAQKFVQTGRELAWIAVMPFLVITTLLIVGWVIWPQYNGFWGWSLLLHTSACIGDFVLINYHFKNRNRGLFTYDDIEQEQRSYYFVDKTR